MDGRLVLIVQFDAAIDKVQLTMSDTREQQLICIAQSLNVDYPLQSMIYGVFYKSRQAGAVFCVTLTPHKECAKQAKVDLEKNASNYYDGSVADVTLAYDTVRALMATYTSIPRAGFSSTLGWRSFKDEFRHCLVRQKCEPLLLTHKEATKKSIDSLKDGISDYKAKDLIDEMNQKVDQLYDKLLTTK